MLEKVTTAIFQYCFILGKVRRMSILEKKSAPIPHFGRRGCREREKHPLFTGIVGLIVFTVMSCATPKPASILQTTENSLNGGTYESDGNRTQFLNRTMGWQLRIPEPENKHGR